jgi:hypothetical protein
MGRSTTPKYAIRVSEGRNAKHGVTPMAWSVKESGKPTAENLAKWVEAYHRSLEPGGVNAHIFRSIGHVPYLTAARIVRNVSGGETVAEWIAPMFMAVGPIS